MKVTRCVSALKVNGPTISNNRLQLELSLLHINPTDLSLENQFAVCYIVVLSCFIANCEACMFIAVLHMLKKAWSEFLFKNKVNKGQERQQSGKSRSVLISVEITMRGASPHLYDLYSEIKSGIFQ